MRGKKKNRNFPTQWGGMGFGGWSSQTLYGNGKNAGQVCIYALNGE
jgi:hypothetical protein